MIIPFINWAAHFSFTNQYVAWPPAFKLTWALVLGSALSAFTAINTNINSILRKNTAHGRLRWPTFRKEQSEKYI
jgi:hypothetical protein